MKQFNPSCERIDNYEYIPPVWKRSYEVYVKAFYRCVSRSREAMSMYRYFDHTHLLTTRTVIYGPPDMLTHILPDHLFVNETLSSALKTKMTNLGVVYFTNSIVLLKC